MGQPTVQEIRIACQDSWLFDGCGERWLFESDTYAGCGKTSAAYVAARQLGCGEFATERIDNRACTVADLRELSNRMHQYGWAGNGRRAFIIGGITMQFYNRVTDANEQAAAATVDRLFAADCHSIATGAPSEGVA